MLRRLVLVPSALLLAVVTGCTASPAPTATPATTPSRPPAPSQAAISWVGAVCSADSGIQAQQDAARIAALSIIPRQPTREQIAGFITNVRSSLAESLTTFQKMPGGVVNGGDQLITAYATAITTALTQLDQAETTANNTATPDTDVLGLPSAAADDIHAVAPAGTDLPGLIAHNPALHAAYQKASDCKGITPLTVAGQAATP